MKSTLIDIINYIENPVLEKDSNTDFRYRLQIFIRVFLICAIASTLITPIFTLLEDFGWVNMDNHKVEEVFKDLPAFAIILIGGLIVPVIEELMFRAPITLFKKPNSFKFAFYAFTIIFAFVHITNFDMTNTVLLLSPILVLPQLFAGIGLGYLRIRFGLSWAILLHCVYNTVFLSIAIIFDA